VGFTDLSRLLAVTPEVVFFGFLGFAGVAILVVEAKKTKPSAKTLAIIRFFLICNLLKINILKQKTPPGVGGRQIYTNFDMSGVLFFMVRRWRMGGGD
jgi:hypothetical protein